MIDKITYEKEWIDHVSNSLGRGNRKADPELVEKVTKALHLLESLTHTDLNFIFKGGTSLLILLNKIYRFSIDIDIIVEDNKETINLNSILDQVISNSSVFLRYEEQDRDNSKNIPKAHYKFFYNSAITDSERYILLDVLDDIYNTSCTLTTRGFLNTEKFKLLESGVKSIKNYIFSESYYIERAVNSASKAAYLSLLLKNNINIIERYNSNINVKELKMSPKRHKMFKGIYKYDSEAYFYWYKCFELIDLTESIESEIATT